MSLKCVLLFFLAGSATVQSAVRINETRGTTGDVIVTVEQKKWNPKSIPYKFHSNINLGQKQEIEMELKTWEDNTCLNFVYNGRGSDYMLFKNENGCYSRFAGNDGMNVISVGKLTKNGKKTCVNPCVKSSAAHGIARLLGFGEQRLVDNNIKSSQIFKNNALKKSQNDFLTLNHGEADWPFDSFMHYQVSDASPKQ